MGREIEWRLRLKKAVREMGNGCRATKRDMLNAVNSIKFDEDNWIYIKPNKYKGQNDK